MDLTAEAVVHTLASSAPRATPRPSSRKRRPSTPGLRICELGATCPYQHEHQHAQEFRHDSDAGDGAGAPVPAPTPRKRLRASSADKSPKAFVGVGHVLESGKTVGRKKSATPRRKAAPSSAFAHAGVGRVLGSGAQV